MIERFKLWLVNKSLAYHEAEVERLLEWKRERLKGSGKAIEMAGYFPLKKFSKER